MNLANKLTHLNKWVSYSQQAEAISFTSRCRHIVTNQDGVALVLALLTMLLVSLIGLFGAITGQTELQVAANEQNAKKALDVADAGVRHALRLLGGTGIAYQNGFNDELNNNGTGGALAAVGSTLTTYPGEGATQYRFFHFGGSRTEDGYYVRVVDNHDADGNQNTDTDQKVIVISRGKIGTAEKTIEALVSPPTPCAITTGDRLDVGDNVTSSDLQLNTVDGFGACVHANGELNVGGDSSFPDGASSSLGDPPGDCNGNPNIAGGNCNNVLWNQPLREMPNTNPGQYGKWVADLGNANSSSITGKFYILHTWDGLGRSVGDITKGGGCYYTHTASPATSLVGRCSGSIPYPDGTTSPADILVVEAERDALINNGISIAAGTCTFSGNSIPPGIYYCDGSVHNSGQVSGTGVTVLSRDDMSFDSQTNLSAFFPNAGSVANTASTAIDNQASPTLQAAGVAARGFLQNLVMMSGNDLNFTANNTAIIGILLIHNQINMTGGKTINGYIFAADGIPSFTGDPHPGGSSSTLNIAFNNFLGSSTINYVNYGTALPLGPPILRAWNDRQW